MEKRELRETKMVLIFYAYFRRFYCNYKHVYAFFGAEDFLAEIPLVLIFAVVPCLQNSYWTAGGSESMSVRKDEN